MSKRLTNEVTILLLSRRLRAPSPLNRSLARTVIHRTTNRGSMTSNGNTLHRKHADDVARSCTSSGIQAGQMNMGNAKPDSDTARRQRHMTGDMTGLLTRQTAGVDVRRAPQRRPPRPLHHNRYT